MSQKLCKIGSKLLLFRHRKSRTGLPLVPKSMILDNLERRNRLGRGIPREKYVFFPLLFQAMLITRDRPDHQNRAVCLVLILNDGNVTFATAPFAGDSDL